MSTQRRIPVCLVLVLAAALACAAPSFGHGPGVRAWLTTGDQVSLLAEQPPATLGAPDPSAPTIAVDPARSYQRIEGLGVATFVLPRGS
jgi:glucosylceramidase